MKQEIFRMESVAYQEQEIVLLDDFNLQICQGEIVGMLSMQSHGMNAFLKLAQTNLPLQDGYVYCGGRLVNSWKESSRTDNRISIIGTEKRLVESLLVYDNVFVLRQGFHQRIISPRLLKKQMAPFLEEVGIDIPVDAKIEDLSVFERITVELLRAVMMGNRLIILHEIGNLLNEEEKKHLTGMIRYYAGKGFAFLYISAHFEEMTEFCGRIACFSNGHIQKIIRPEEMKSNIEELFIEEYSPLVRHREGLQGTVGTAGQRELLRIGLKEGQYLKELSFSVYERECLALEFHDHNALREFETLFVEKEAAGRAGAGMWIAGQKEEFIRNQKVAVISEQPAQTMIFPELSYLDNLCFSLGERVPTVWSFGSIRKSIRQEYEPVLGAEVFDTHVDRLGINQKLQLVYTRVLLQKPQVVFCIQPFKGSDRSHRVFIWKMIEMLLAHGIAVVLLALDFSDVLPLADRLVVVGETTDSGGQRSGEAERR